MELNTIADSFYAGIFCIGEQISTVVADRFKFSDLFIFKRWDGKQDQKN